VDENKPLSEEEMLERLLRLAGPRPATPAEVEERVRAVVHARWRATLAARRRRTALFGVGGSLAAAALLLLGIAIFRGSGRTIGTGAPASAPVVATLTRVVGSLRTTDGGTIGPGEALHAGMEMATGPGDRAALLFTDGTTLRLDHDTRLRLLPEAAIELDSGALYADTAGRAAAAGAIAIRTPFGIVRDIGTRFEVRLEGEGLSVSVRQGLARLEREGRSHDAEAGSQIVAARGAGVTTRPVPIQGSRWEWILDAAPPFTLDGKTLTAFLDWVEREDGRRVRFADPALEARAATTILHGPAAGLRPDLALAAILPTCGLRHRIDGETILIEAAEESAPPG
jgi:ferric-dicitrate binding protein FerR (iron transport regulator)